MKEKIKAILLVMKTELVDVFKPRTRELFTPAKRVLAKERLANQRKQALRNAVECETKPVRGYHKKPFPTLQHK